MSTEITPRQAATVLHHVGESGGYPATGFAHLLLTAIARADSVNLARLTLGYPGLVAAWRLAHDLDGICRLQAIAEREDGHDEVFGEDPPHIEAYEREEYAVRWTGHRGGLAGAPLASQIDMSLRARHALGHAEEIRGWQAGVGIAPDAEPLARTLLCAATQWRPLADQAESRATGHEIQRMLTPADGHDWLELVAFAAKAENEGFHYAYDEYGPKFQADAVQAIAADRDRFKEFFESHSESIDEWWDTPDAEKQYDAHIDAQRAARQATQADGEAGR